jgi:hypothetical protein
MTDRDPPHEEAPRRRTGTRHPEDPTRVLLTSTSIPPWRRRELDENPREVCLPSWDDDDDFIRDWLAANAPEATVEAEITHEGGYADSPQDAGEGWVGTSFDGWLRFKDAAQATAYVEWLEEVRRAWAERHALVKEGEPWCHDCGGPAVAARVTREVQVRHVLIRHAYPGHVCDHCPDGGSVLVKFNDPYYWRVSELNVAARAAFGIAKGVRHRPDRADVRVVLETDETTTDDEFASMLKAAVDA